MGEFAEFLRAFERQRGGNREAEDTLDVLDAFVALGGEEDRSGFVERKRLVQLVREEFSMTIKIDRIFEELDKDQDGKLNYGEFSSLSSSFAVARPSLFLSGF